MCVAAGLKAEITCAQHVRPCLLDLDSPAGMVEFAKIFTRNFHNFYVHFKDCIIFIFPRQVLVALCSVKHIMLFWIVSRELVQ